MHVDVVCPDCGAGFGRLTRVHVPPAPPERLDMTAQGYSARPQPRQVIYTCACGGVAYPVFVPSVRVPGWRDPARARGRGPALASLGRAPPPPHA